MNPAQLLAHFGRISEAPDAIPRLRQFILDLAVRGKLGEQDPDDEPASELLKRIQSGRAQLVKEGIGKKEDSPTGDESNRAPFPTPAHWAWLPVNRVGALSGGMTPSKSRPDFWDGRINWFSPKDIKSDALVESELKITPAAVAETGLQLYPPGCLFIVARSGILKRTFPVAINRTEGTVNQDLKVLRPFLVGMERYLQVMFRGMTDYILTALVKTGTTVQSLKYDDFELALVPIPPFAEQHRIVAKVDELTALCDRLEAAQTERETRRDRVVAASLNHLNEPAADGNRPFRDHARFHLRYLPRLTTRPEHIQQLRQTILSLAVRGRLVPQDPNDELASEMLGRIAQDLKADGSPDSDRTQVMRALAPDSLPHAIPNSWAWVQAQAIAQPGQRITYGILKPVWVASGVPTVRVTEMRSGTIDVAALRRCDEGRAARFAKTRLAEGDLLVSKDGTIGKTAFVPPGLGGGNITQHLLRFPISRHVDRQFVRLCVDAPPCQAWMAGETKGVALQGVNVGDFRRMPIPLPPLAEQHRIVAQVDELMAICDQLEAQLTTAQAESRRLLEAALRQAFSPVA